MPLPGRLENAAVAYVRYLGKLFWPADLAIFYPHPAYWPHYRVFLSALLLLAITGAVLAAAWRDLLRAKTSSPAKIGPGVPDSIRNPQGVRPEGQIRNFRYLPVGWFWFLGALVPVIGVIQVGGQSMADRYSYVPSVGIFIILVWGFNDLKSPKSQISNPSAFSL